VLVVDDDADARDVVATALVHAGARVTTAPSAAEAMAIAGEDDVHIVLTDIAMPKDSGYDLLRTLRGHPRTARARIVAMTGRGHIDEGDRSLAAGFDGYVGKPLQAPHLIDLLASLAGRSG
jgi:CheY-like chemotaxis protein